MLAFPRFGDFEDMPWPGQVLIAFGSCLDHSGLDSMLSKRDQCSSYYDHHLLDNTFLDTRIIARGVYRTSIVAQSVDRGLEAEAMQVGSVDGGSLHCRSN